MASLPKTRAVGRVSSTASTVKAASPVAPTIWTVPVRLSGAATSRAQARTARAEASRTVGRANSEPMLARTVCGL